MLNNFWKYASRDLPMAVETIPHTFILAASGMETSYRQNTLMKFFNIRRISQHSPSKFASELHSHGETADGN